MLVTCYFLGLITYPGISRSELLYILTLKRLLQESRITRYGFEGINRKALWGKG